MSFSSQERDIPSFLSAEQRAQRIAEIESALLSLKGRISTSDEIHVEEQTAVATSYFTCLKELNMLIADGEEVKDKPEILSFLYGQRERYTTAIEGARYGEFVPLKQCLATEGKRVIRQIYAMENEGLRKAQHRFALGMLRIACSIPENGVPVSRSN